MKKMSIYSGALSQGQNIPIVQDIKHGLFLTFLFCTTSLSGYLLTSSMEG